MRRFCFTTLLIFSLFVCENVIQAQNKSEIITVKGTITNEKGQRIREPVIIMGGISSEKGEVYSTETGTYKLNVESNGKLVICSSNYYTKIIKVENRTNIDVILEKDDRNSITILFKVTDEEGKPLKNVKFTPKLHPKELDLPIIYITNIDGTLMVIGFDQDIYTFSLDGYETQTVAVDKRDEINVVMKKLKE